MFVRLESFPKNGPKRKIDAKDHPSRALFPGARLRSQGFRFDLPYVYTSLGNIATVESYSLRMESASQRRTR